MEQIDKNIVKRAFLKRAFDANKGSVGNLFCLCGCYSMAGAAIMAGKAALRSGIGLLKMAVPKSIYPIVGTNILESVFYPVEENEVGTFVDSNFFIKKANESKAVLIGCGMGVNKDTKELVYHMIRECKVPMVIDADGLNSVAENPNILLEKKAPIVITPHPGEMARLVKKSVGEVQANRETIAKEFAKKYNVCVVLKGSGTVVCDGERQLINQTGNAGMATGGSGDVLAGMTGSMLAQNPTKPFEVACGAVHLHGIAGDIAKEKFGEISMLPTDLIECIPLAIKNCNI